MSDDYGVGDVEIAVGLFALRTFAIADGKLTSIVQGSGHWESGVCVARCLVHDHAAPAPKCSCGIYGAFTVEALVDQYPQFACRIIAVIAPEGQTTVGTVGLRTAAARIVAYWCAEPEPSRRSSEVEVCAEECPGARRFFDQGLMARLYGLAQHDRQ